MLGPAPLGPVDLLEKDWSAFAVLPQDADGSRTPRRVPRRSLAGVALPPGVGVDQPLTIEFTDSETGAESGEERDACERGVGPSGGGAWRVARRVGGAGLLGPQLEPLVSIQGRIAASSTREVAPRLEDEEGSGAAAGGADRAAGSQATPSTGHYSCRGVDDTSSDARSQAALEGSEPAMEDGGGSLQGSASVCQADSDAEADALDGRQAEAGALNRSLIALFSPPGTMHGAEEDRVFSDADLLRALLARSNPSDATSSASELLRTAATAHLLYVSNGSDPASPPPTARHAARGPTPAPAPPPPPPPGSARGPRHMRNVSTISHTSLDAGALAQAVRATADGVLAVPGHASSMPAATSPPPSPVHPSVLPAVPPPPPPRKGSGHLPAFFSLPATPADGVVFLPFPTEPLPPPPPRRAGWVDRHAPSLSSDGVPLL